MDVAISSAITQSSLSFSHKSSDWVIHRTEKTKFRKDRDSVNPLQSSDTLRFIPLVMNNFGLRGPHFQATLREYAMAVVSRPSGCRLLQGPFAVSRSVAIHKILHSWGSRMTWCVQREHTAQILHGVDAHQRGQAMAATFLAEYDVP